MKTVLFVVCFCLSMWAQVEQEHGKELDAIFQAWDNGTSPGAAVSVIRKGKVVFEKGYGLANLEYDVPVKPETIFHVASVSKQFTAMAVVLLERDGKLSIEDDLHKYLPELPDYGHRITIRNLLQHTSGIRDQWQTLGLAGWSLEDVITQKQILGLLFRQKELNFAPGSEHLYSNGGYTLAAEIVARVSGKSFPEFCAERIFGPLKMSHTHFHQDLHQVVKNRSYSYAKGQNGYEYLPLNYANAGATSLFTTATDLVRWLDNFREPAVGGKDGIARLLETGVLNNGTKIEYALGISVDKHRGLRRFSHAGGDAGFRSYVCWYPDQELGIAVVSNLASFNPVATGQRTAAVFLQSAMAAEEAKPAPAAARTFVTVDPAVLKSYAGTYPLPKIGQTLVADVQDGKLFAAGPVQPPLELKPVSSSRFYVERLSADIDFIPGPDGSMKVKITQPGAVTEGERIPDTPAPDLASYAGTYWSDELETQYRVFVSNGKLKISHVHHGDGTLTASGRDSFSSDKWFMSQVKFTRDDKDGRITGALLGGGRVRGVRFVKK